jgi:hypothetical protein
MSAPKVMVFKDKVTKIISIRGFIDIDYITNQQFTLLQWSRNPVHHGDTLIPADRCPAAFYFPVRFISWTKKPGLVKPPLFLLSPRWVIKHRLGRLKIGITYKPFDVTNFWRSRCVSPIDLEHCRALTTSTKKTSCATGSRRPIKE